MEKIFLLGFNFLKFWFLESPIGLISYFASLNSAMLKLFSLRLLLVTYFKPWKNEYREGLVGFSVFMGMFVKTWIILFDILLLFIFITLETAFILAFLAWPFATIGLLFIKL